MTIDTVAPGTPTITTAAGLTNDATPTIVGTAEAGSTVTISINGTVLDSVVAGPNGVFSFTPTTNLAQGANSITATARDLAGNVSASSTAVILTIDSVAPGVPVITTAAGLTTDATPTITGTAEAGATVTISDNGIVLGTAVAGPDGVFSFTPATNLVQGTNSFTVTARDLAGNVSAASAAVALTIDSVAPGAPVITTAAGLTNDATPTITGTAEAGATVTISDNGIVLGTAVAGPNGVFSFTPGADLVQGPNSFTVTARDLAGNVSAASAAVALIIDSVAPGAPVITTPAGITNDATPTITGTAEAGATVTISDNGTVLGTAVAGPNGAFSFTPTANLGQGSNVLTVTARDLAGNISAPSAAVALTIDSVAPGAPVITTAAGLTNDATPTITGTAEAGATVTISDNGIVLGTAVAGPNGVFSFTPGADLVQGPNSFTVTARDLAGNVSAPSAAVALIIDSVAPGAPVITTAAGLTNDATPTITGTAEVGATVTISNNGTVLGTAVAGPNGVFSFTPGADLVQGANSITVTARDLAGSISAPSAAVALTIDSLAPGAPVITTAAGLTNDATPTITGTAEAGSTVTISNNGTVIGTAVAGLNGVFSFAPAADLVQGPNLLTVTARDLAGNVSAPSAAVALTIDSLAPGAPVITTAAGLTNDATPTITGTAEAGATVTISDNGIVLGTAVAGPNGLFSFTPAADLVQGPNLLTVTARDLAGNVSTPSAAVTLTVDSLAPGAPTITTAPGLTPDATPTITGTAEAGATVTISDNGIVLGTAVADTNGVFSFTPAADLVQGSNVLTVTARDLAGNVSVPSAAVALTIDSLAPGAPVITIAPGLTNDATPTITGTAEAGSTVTISNNGTVLGTAVAGPNGIFSFTPAADLAQGVNTVTVTARDLAGNVSAASAAVALTVDSLTPGAPVITTAAGLTPDATPTITGTAEAGSTVTLSDNGTVLGTAVADTNGIFSFTPAADLAQGVNTVTVTARDLAGNVSAPSAAVALTIDSVAPGAPTITAFAGTIANATPTITGTAEAGATVTVRSDALVLGTVIAAADGSFSLTPTVPLPNGPANLTATAQDGAGNLSAPSVVTPVVIDTRVPGAPLVNYVAPTNDNTPVITGTALAGDLITITSNGSPVGVGTAGPGGLFSVTLTVPLADGTNALEVTATPLGGSASPAAPVTVLVDTVAPLAPSITAFAGPTNDTTPTITGTAEAGATVTILDNGILIGTAVAGMNGGFSFTPTIPLTAGSNVLTATAQDLVGNVSPTSVAVALTIDSVAPDAPTLTTAPGLTNDATPTITGTAEVGSTVTISNNGIVLGTALADTNGAFSFTPATDLAQGANSFTVTARDLAGNVSAASAAVALTIDSLAPDAPVITTAAGLTNDATPTITGTAEAGSTVTISDNGIVLGTTVADTNGVFSFTPATDLAQGANSVTVTAQDLAGNISAPSSAVALTIDSVAPGAPVITTPAGLINDATPTITGTAEAGSTVTISDNGILLGTALAGANGVFSFTPTTPLTEGSNLLTATARGPAGNVSTPSAAVALTIDSLAPDAPVVTTAAGLTTDATPTITGTAEAGSTVTISNNGIVLGTALADTNGAFSFTPATDLAQGANSFTVTARDLAGNVSAASAAVALTIDSLAPDAPVITTAAGLTNDATPTITGTAEAGSTVTISDNGIVLGIAVAGPNGVFSFTPAADLAQGASSFTVTAQDLAGNVSAPSTAVALTIDSVAPGAPVITTAAGLTTDATPTITGTAEAGSTVTLSDNGTVLGTATAGANGVFSYTPVADLAQGTNSITVTAQDLAGNVSAPSAAVALTIDSVAPNAPSITAFVAPTNDTTPTITGTAEPGATVIVSNGTTQIGSTVAASDGSFSLTPAALPEGTASLTAVAVDAAGNASPASAATPLVIDLTPPGAPVFDALAPTTDTTPTITGTAEAGTTVTISDNGTVLGTALVGTDGRFTFTPTIPLADGNNVLTGTAADAAGNVGAGSTPVTLVVTATPGNGDTTPPTAPVLDALAPTNDTTPTITGTAEPGSTVIVSNGTTQIGSTVAAADGSFSLTPAALPEGTASLTAVAVDAAGNASPASAATPLVIDLTPPGAPVFDALAPTTDTTPTITGTAEAGATVTISDNGTVLGTTLAGTDGRFTFTPTIPLADGNNVLTGTAADAAGNVGAGSTPVTLVVTATPGNGDTTPPTAPVLDALAPTNDTTPTITGTAEPGSTVIVSNGTTQIGSTVAAADGSFSLTPAALPEGTASLTAVAVDAAGNASPASAATPLVIDLTPPGAPVFDALAPTTDTTPTITGTAEAGATITISSDGTVLGTTLAGTDGRFTFTPTIPLADGNNVLTGTAADAAGNVGAGSTPVTLVVTATPGNGDTTPPTAPVLDALAPTNDTTPTITGTAEPGSTVIVSNGTTQIGSTVAAADGSFSLTPAALPEGTASLTAVAVDAAGNASPASAATPLVIDLTPPGAPVFDALAPTTDTTPTITGTAEAGATITISSDGTVLGTALVGTDGRFTFTPTIPLADGNNVLTGTAADAAGNVGAGSTPVTLVVTATPGNGDTTPPTAPVLDALAPTNDTTPTITGTAEPGSTVIVSNGTTQIGSTVAAADGSFSLTPAALPEGTASLTAVAVDAAGNASPASAATPLVIDLTPPGAPVFDALAPTTDTTPTITGTAEAGATITISSDGTVLGTALVGTDGRFTFTPTAPLADGNTVLTADIIDAAGNVGPSTSRIAMTIDATSPGNVAPQAVSEAISTVTHAPAVTGNVLANDTDPNAGDVLHVTSVRFANGVTAEVPTTGTATVVSDHGTLQISADGHYSYQAIGANNVGNGAQTRTEIFTYTVSDEQGLSNSASLSVSLQGVAPAAAATFGFAFVDAHVTLAGESLVLTDPEGVHHDISGIGTLHFTDGTIQENDGHSLVDDVWYLSNNLDVWRAHVDADTHYETFGWREGRDPNAYFHTREYLAENPDVAAAGVNPLEHYFNYGEREGRSPGSDFAPETYLSLNPDVKAAGANALEHYLQHGQREGRSVYEGESSPTLVGDFDVEFYLEHNPDVAAAARSATGVQPGDYAFQHYLDFGAKEGRAPNELFDPAAYLAANPDVAANGANPLIHYQEYGWHEGRDPGPGFHTNAYLEANPDVAAAGWDPLQHFLEFGMKEGRLPV